MDKKSFQLAYRGRLYQVRIKSSGQRIPPILLFAVAGQSSDDGFRTSRCSTHARHDLITVHSGQTDVEKHNLGLKLLEGEQRRWSIEGLLHLMPAETGQYFCQELCQTFIVINDQNSTIHRRHKTSVSSGSPFSFLKGRMLSGIRALVVA